MLKTFPIDFVRSALEFALFKNRDNHEYFSDTDISLFSFYEHLASDEEVNRYVARYKDLIYQQNRENLIGSGIITATSATTMINNKQVFVSPFEWACTLRCTLGNRDKMLETLYKAIEELRGRKTDIALFDNGKLQTVGTIGNSNDNYIHDYDYIGYFSDDIITNTMLNARIDDAVENANLGFSVDDTKVLNVFIDHKGKLELWKGTPTGATRDWAWELLDDLLFEHNSFEKMKLSLSFTDIKASEPYTIDGTEYFEITFSGGATLTTKNVMLGNDLVKVKIAKNKIITGTNSEYSFKVNNALVYYTLDPQEKASGNSAGTIENKIKSNYFKTNTHTDSLTITKQYTFVYNTDVDLLNQWYEYASYGVNGLDTGGTFKQTSMTPNIIYSIREITNSWYDFKVRDFIAKIVEDIDINDTDSDVITIGIYMQLQGENN